MQTIVAAVAGLALGAAPAVAVELSVKADAPRALIVEGAPTTVTVTVKGSANEKGEYELRQEFVDRYGQTKTPEPLRLTLENQWQQKVEVPVEYYGPATYKATLHKVGDDAPLASVQQQLIKPIPVPTLTREQRANSYMGINLHDNADWKALGAMGIHWARDYSWGWLGDGSDWPAAKNKVDFSKKEPTADAAGITVLPVMQKAFRTPDGKFFITDGEAIEAGYERLSNALPQLKYWELDNEAELQHQRNSDDMKKWHETYLVYIKHADLGLKRAGHGAKVVLNGDAGIHPDRAKELIDKVGDHFSVINYHFYAGTVAPELAKDDINTGAEDRPRTVSFIDSLRQTNRIAKAHGKEAWLTEIGWSAHSGAAVGDRLQNAYFQRSYMISRWAGTDKVFWFWDRELPAGGRFSSMEFIDYKGQGARPLGAASAALSKFTALAELAGSVYLGPDRWCMVFKRPEGGFTVAAWAVEANSEYELPEVLSAASESFDMYGNPLRDKKLTTEPAYFHVASIPQNWADQLQVEWVSPTIINVYQGEGATVEIEMPGQAEIRFADMPAGAQVGEWNADGKLHKATLSVAPDTKPGSHAIYAIVAGEGWEKRFPLTLRIRPSVEITAAPFIPGRETEIELRSLVATPAEITLSAGQGKVEPAQVSLSPNGTATAKYAAPADATESVTLKAEFASGAVQELSIRPRNLNVPKAGKITLDGDLSDWPEAGNLPPSALRVQGPLEGFDPSMKIAWSSEGLYVASRIPVGEGFTHAQQPGNFWEWTSIEMSMLAANENQHDPAKQHLFFFVPYKDNAAADWRIFAGEWLKTMPDGKKQTLNDDKRFRTAMKYDGQTVTIEVLIPNDVLGAAPKAGEEWPLAISTKIAKALTPRTVAGWPGGKGSGVGAWGRVRFVE